MVLAGVFAAVMLGVSQTLNLFGPEQMGRCEEAAFTLAFTAGDTHTASALVFMVTRPNAGFAYVPGSGLITLPDGTSVSADPSPLGP